MRQRRVCALIAGVWLSLAAGNARAQDPGTAGPTATPETPVVRRLAALAPDTAWTTNQIRWLDGFHGRVYRRLDSAVNWADHLLADRRVPPMPSEDSTFAVSLETEYRSEEGGLDVELNFDADVHFPNTERRLAAFVNTLEAENLPGLDLKQRQSPVYLGVRNRFGRTSWLKAFDTSAGIKGDWLPVLFGKIQWKDDTSVGPWLLYTRQTAFWFSDDGFGAKGLFSADRWFGPRAVVRSISAVRWMLDRERVDGEQTFTANLLFEGSERDLHHVVGLRGSVFGRLDAGGEVERYRLGLLYRAPLYRRWLYYAVTPRVDWAEASDWGPEYSVSVAFDALFCGTPDR